MMYPQTLTNNRYP